MAKNSDFGHPVKSRKKWAFLGYLLRAKIPLVRKKGPKQGVTRGTPKTAFFGLFCIFRAF
jgi:hypothetical protein